MDLDSSGATKRNTREGNPDRAGRFQDQLPVIKDLPDQHAEYIKLGQYFIDNVAKHHKKQIFLSNVLDLFRLLGVNNLAEGVEAELDPHTFRELNFGLTPGYHIARPTIGNGQISDTFMMPKKAKHWVGGDRVRPRCYRPGPRSRRSSLSGTTQTSGSCQFLAIAAGPPALSNISI